MTDIDFMKEALKEAKKALEKDEVPIGCVIVKDNQIISNSFNQKQLDNVATHHAEILAINRACKKLNTWHLDDCILYTTVEPCLMCTGAIIQSRIKKVVYGTSNNAFGYISKLENNKIEIIKGVLEKECQEILTDFFKAKRISKSSK